MSEETDKLNQSAANASVTLDDLAAAAKRADDIFDNRFMNIRSITDGLNAVGGALTPLAKAFAVLESRFQLLNRMTDYGANFGYSIRTLDDAANNTRMTLGQLAGIVKENSENLAMFGAGVQGGVDKFTTVINSFQDNAEAAQDRFGRSFEESARMLGYSFEQLNEGILDYSQISALTRNRERIDSTRRNQSMAAYLETVDELAQLTGKQRDAISDSITAEARKGQTIIRAGQLGERGDEYAKFVGLMNSEFKGPLGDLSSDILTAGFGLTDDTRRMQGMFAPFANALQDLRRAYEDPTKTDAQIKALEDNVRAQAAGVQDLNIMQLGVYSNLNSVTGTIADTATSLGTSMARINEYRDMIREQEGRQLTAAEAYTEIQEKIRARQGKVLEQAPEGTFQRAQQDFITRTIEFERTSNQLRVTATDAAYRNLAKIMNDLSSMFGKLTTGLGSKLAESLKFLDYNLSSVLDFGSVDFATNVQNAITTATALGNNEATTLLTDLQAKLIAMQNAGNDTSRNAVETEINKIIADINRLKANDMVINANKVIVNDNAPGTGVVPQSPPDNMFGSMKAYGRLFNNFGQETMQPLHGLEAVTTPAQMADIVMNAARGGQSAFAQDIADAQNSMNSTNMIDVARFATARTDSMLNTINARVNDIATIATENNSPDAAVNEFMNQLPRTLKSALEDAMGSSLKPTLEQLVTIGTAHAETSNKIRRSFSGITNDYMRSA